MEGNFFEHAYECELHLLRRGYTPVAFWLPDEPASEWNCYHYDALDAEGCVGDGTNYHVNPIDMKLVNRYSAKARALLTGTRTPQEIITHGDRSSAIWHVLQTFRRIGYGPGQAFLAVWDSVLGEKPREKGRDWFIDVLDRVWHEPVRG